MLVLLVALVFIFVVVVLVCWRKKTKENFTDTTYYPQNVRLWPQNVYSVPFNPKYGEGWPANMYSRSYYWSPTFYAGNPLIYYYRPTSKFNPYKITRNRWIRNNGKYNFVSNRLDYINDAANYHSISSCPPKFKDSGV